MQPLNAAVRTALAASLVAGLLATAAPAGAAGATHCVGAVAQVCQSHHPTIQSAVDTAGAGDIVLVGPGAYVAPVDVPPGKDGLQIRSASGPANTIVRTVPGIVPVFMVGSQNVVIEGFAFEQQDDNQSHHGISTANGHGIVARKNTFSGFTIAVALGAGVRDGMVAHNRISGGVTAIYAAVRAVDARILSNRVDGAAAGINMPGVTVGEGQNSGFSIAGNSFIDTNKGIEIGEGDLGSHVLRNNCFSGEATAAIENASVMPVDARFNYFGAFGGPAMGQAVSGPVDADPFAFECDLDWTESALNPLLPLGDDVSGGSPTVVKVGDTYHMWYSAKAADDRRYISHTTSADGTDWATPEETSFTGEGCEVDEECDLRTTPSVIRVGDEFRMYYWGYRFDWGDQRAEPTGSGSKGKSQWVATSTDGVNFTEQGRLTGPGMPTFNGNPFPVLFSVHPMPTDTGYAGYFEVHDGSIYRAETTDPEGVGGWSNWEPVLDADADCESSCTRPFVLQEDGIYRMFVGYGLGPKERRDHIGTAVSLDGVNFSPLAKLLSITDPGVPAWRSHRVAQPWVIAGEPTGCSAASCAVAGDGDLQMWFTGKDATGDPDLNPVRIGRANLDRGTFVTIDAATDFITQANEAAAEIAGTAEPGAQVQVVVRGGGARSSTRNTSAGTNGRWAIRGIDVRSLPDGPAQFEATVADGRGHKAKASRDTVKDTTGSVIDDLLASNPAFSPNGDGMLDDTRITASVPDAVDWTLEITSGGNALVTREGTSDAIDETWDGSSDDGAALPDGAYTATVTATDADDNVTTGSIIVTIDTVGPAVGLSVPAPGTRTNDNTPAVSGRAGTGPGDIASVDIGVATAGGPVGSPTAVVPAADGTFSTNMPTLSDGTYTLTASQADEAGNIGSSSRSLTIDTKPPAVAVMQVTTPITDANAAAVTVAGTAEPGSVLSVRMAIGGAETPARPSLATDGTFTIDDFDARSLPAGVGLAIARATDAAGNTAQATLKIEKIAAPIAPTVLIVDHGDGFVGPSDNPSALRIRVTHNGPQQHATIPLVLTDAGNRTLQAGSAQIARGKSHTFVFDLVDRNVPNGRLVATATNQATEGSDDSFVDLVAPETTLDAPRGTYFSTPAFRDLEFTGTATDSHAGIGSVRVELSTADGRRIPATVRMTPIAGGVRWTADFRSSSVPVGSGNYTVSAAATDRAGNKDASPATGSTFVIGA